MPLTLLAGPANAGKVALLLERYLEELPREPILIVPNRSDVDRVERELLGRDSGIGGDVAETARVGAPLVADRLVSRLIG